ncbi:MAG: hypothetical protein WC280_02820 [Patescibacteria group bacterium]
MEIVVKNTIKDGDEVIGVSTNLGDLKISHWSEKRLTIFNGMEFKIPSSQCKHMKFVPERYKLDTNGEVALMPGYWNCGVFADEVLVTRCYYHDNEEKTEKELPLGSTVWGTVEIKLSTNKKTGVEKIIINHFYIKKTNAPADKRITIAGDAPKTASIFEMKIPNSKKGAKIRVIKKR